MRLPSVDVGGYFLDMKTAISLPDEIFEEAERLARWLKKSRSELYREAELVLTGIDIVLGR